MSVRVLIALGIAAGTAVTITFVAGCDDSTSSPGPSTTDGSTSINLDGNTSISPPTDAADTDADGDASTTPPTSNCPSGNPRPPTTATQAFQMLVGNWLVVPQDDPSIVKRTLDFGVGQSGDLACAYADQGGITLDYVQNKGGTDQTCDVRTHYLLRIESNGVAVQGRWNGDRAPLYPDGGVITGAATIPSTWTFDNGQLYFDSQHFTSGSGLTCP